MSIDETEHELTHFDLVIYPQYADSIREICEELNLVIAKFKETSEKIRIINQKEVKLKLEYQLVTKSKLTIGSVRARLHERDLDNQIQECFRLQLENQESLIQLSIAGKRHRNHLNVKLKAIADDFGLKYSLYVQQKIRKAFPEIHLDYEF